MSAGDGGWGKIEGSSSPLPTRSGGGGGGGRSMRDWLDGCR